MLRALFALSLLGALWVALVLWSQENTLSLAAAGKIPFGAAWGYRFRSAELLGAAENTPVVLQAVRPCGARILCLLLIALHLPALVAPRRRVFLGIALPGTALTLMLFFSLASPALVAGRYRVMGGRGAFDVLHLRTGAEKIAITEDCLAAVNPSDLHAMNSLELIELPGAQRFAALRILDLKIVEENYRLLRLKDEKGAPLFSDAARAFAAAELTYAQKLLPELQTVKSLCLIANFDTLPQNETAPFSRARKIIDARTKAGLDTKVIQLPAGFSRR